MGKIIFKQGSQVHLLFAVLSNGRSLTDDEARDIGVRRITQRAQDLKDKFEDAGHISPVMVIYEANEGRGGTHARYFMKGYGCALETKPNAKML